MPVPPTVPSGTAPAIQTTTDKGMDAPIASGEHIQRIHHPLSGEPFQLPLDSRDSWLERQCTEAITALTQNCDDDRARFLALWRFLPTRLAATAPALALLPADTRVPDHSIWNHLALNVALTAAMRPVLDAYGPTALIFPGLRGNPLYDMDLGKCYDFAPFTTLKPQGKPPQPDVLLTGSLPNTFLALVPAAAADNLAQDVEQACRKTWQEIGDVVLHTLEGRWGNRTQ